LRIDAVNATFVIASTQVGPAFEFLREIFRMFENEPIHVRDVERAIGPSLEHGWAKPIIRRGDEFAVLLIGSTMARKCHTVGFKDLTVYNIVGRLAGEHAVGKIGSEEFTAIGHG